MHIIDRVIEILQVLVFDLLKKTIRQHSRRKIQFKIRCVGSNLNIFRDFDLLCHLMF